MKERTKNNVLVIQPTYSQRDEFFFESYLLFSMQDDEIVTNVNSFKVDEYKQHYRQLIIKS